MTVEKPSAVVRILVVDDDAAARRMMRRVLERSGYAVDEAPDGRSGLDRVHATRPDLLLLDLRMPGELSGMEVATLLRDDETVKGMPIVIVSASAHLDAREIIAKLGCDAFVEKPVDFDELRETIARLLPS
ncbi:MAG: response regulator [Gaiellales bacterium]